MKRPTACLAVAAFLGSGLFAADAAPATGSPDRQRVLRPHVKPGEVQPDRKQTVTPKPRVKPGMTLNNCPAHFDRVVLPGRGYDCVFRFTPVCGPGMKLGSRTDPRRPWPELRRLGGPGYLVRYSCFSVR